MGHLRQTPGQWGTCSSCLDTGAPNNQTHRPQLVSNVGNTSHPPIDVLETLPAPMAKRIRRKFHSRSLRTVSSDLRQYSRIVSSLSADQTAPVFLKLGRCGLRLRPGNLLLSLPLRLRHRWHCGRDTPPPRSGSRHGR